MQQYTKLRVRFIFVQNASPHDDRKGHHYYTRLLHRPTQACIVVMTLAVIMLCKKMQHTPKLKIRCNQTLFWHVIICMSTFIGSYIPIWHNIIGSPLTNCLAARKIELK